MRVNETGFFQEALRFIKYGSQFGWHERNAGNISFRLNHDEIEGIKVNFTDANEFVKLKEPISDMGGEYIFTTVSGSYFVDLDNAPESKFCICAISDNGDSYRVVWGGLKPTSEICGHLFSLSVLKKRGAGRAVYHCHPANTVALTYLLNCDDKTFSEALWESETECAFVFPEGVGVVDFYVPGSFELAKATSLKLHEYNAVIWSFHGLFATGESIGSAFGLAHAIEKAAEIRLKVISSGRPIQNTITKEQQSLSAMAFGYNLKEFDE
ncbi:MAG: rhamnulose-1-phosphate aldolase [Clostridia bacterium]|nr:rhamnulose-1-phosphate aldolase [Clostridia bacterium]